MINNDQIFLSKDVQKGTESAKYNKQLVGIVVSGNHKELVDQHMEMDCFNAYGLRKGSAIYCVSGTTAPPSQTSIARRGDWSVGTVLDCYWHFCPIGDEYLGRIAVGLHPNSLQFDILPPHWTVGNPQSNEDIVAAMNITFGTVVSNHETFSWQILSGTLACIVFHSNDLQETMRNYPGGNHEFSKVKILQSINTDLLTRLKELVTIHPTPGVMEQPTGIPPHIEQMRLLHDCYKIMKEVKEGYTNQNERIVGAINNAIEQ